MEQIFRRIRGGDDQAARELVERYEPVICREVWSRSRCERRSSFSSSLTNCSPVMFSFVYHECPGAASVDVGASSLSLIPLVAAVDPGIPGLGTVDAAIWIGTSVPHTSIRS
jgi:hypothetical protein